MSNPANYKQVLRHFNNAPKEVREYFPWFSELVEHYSLDVSISYVFSRVEAAKHMTIYCGIVKLHWCDFELTKELVDKDHMDRGRFRCLFKTVFGKSINQELLDKLSKAEAVRDKISHGKKWSDAQARVALVDILDFATKFNDFVNTAAGFQPFADLRGFKGRKKALSKNTTRWVLRGMGIPGKVENE
jgi:hypothetical protein